MDQSKRPSVLIAGVHQSSEAYPNTMYRLKQLKAAFDTLEFNEPLWDKGSDGVSSVRSPMRMLWRVLAAHSRLMWRVATTGRRDILYLPYPAIGMVIAAGLLPRWFRPKHFVVDAFISIYDTIINDRKLWKPDAVFSKLLWWLERSAFRKATLVIVDTSQNAEFYSRILRLPRDRFVAIPLATNELEYVPHSYVPSDGSCRVLFVGTFVPLHGIETIVAAAKKLSGFRNINFRILGDGADAGKMEAVVQRAVNIDWQRRWFSAKELAEEIESADICLGIFGSTAKAQRVCPYKLYAYARVGRATITGATEWLRSLGCDEWAAPFYGVRVGDEDALAEAIKMFAEDAAIRKTKSELCAQFYREHLSNARSFRQLEEVLLNMFSGHSG